MIKRHTYYTLTCDRCGYVPELETGTYHEALDLVPETGWLAIGNRHYCPDCYYYDDNDNPQPRER